MAFVRVRRLNTIRSYLYHYERRISNIFWKYRDRSKIIFIFAVRKKFHNIFRPRARSDIPVFRFSAKQKIAHAPANGKGLKTSRLERVNNSRYFFWDRNVFHKECPPTRIRTWDRSLKRRLLYQLSYGRIDEELDRPEGFETPTPR